jgi:hypothetical protein
MIDFLRAFGTRYLSRNARKTRTDGLVSDVDRLPDQAVRAPAPNESIA